MPLKRILAVTSFFALAVPHLALPGPTSAYPKCKGDCTKLSGTYTQKQIEDTCKKNGGWTTGPDASTGAAYGCIKVNRKDATWVSCDSNGQCVGGHEGEGPARVTNTGRVNPQSILGSPPTQAR